MVALGVTSHGVGLGGFILVPIPGVITVRALVAKVCSVCVAPLVPASPFLRSLG